MSGASIRPIETRRAVIITGAASGIGAATARAAAAHGWAVCVNYRSRENEARRLVSEIEAGGAPAFAIRADTSKPSEITAMFAAVDSRFGRIDGLVNNAGMIGWEGRVESSTPDSLARLWETNVTGYFICAAEAVRRMSNAQGGRGGAIVNVSSLAGRTGGKPGRVHYAASKGAIDAFTKGLAREVAGEGIRVNGVAPGLIATDLHAPFGGPPAATGVPLGRAGTADEVAAAIIWLLSDASSFIAGATIEVGGGA